MADKVAPAQPAMDGDDETVEINGFKYPRSIADKVRPNRKFRASITTRLLGNLQKEATAKGTFITAILFLDADPGFEKLKEVIAARLLKIPRYRSRMVTSFGRQMAWREVPLEAMDMDYHFSEVLHEGVSEPELIKWIEGMYHGWSPDLMKPLWQFHYVPKLDDGRACVITRISHIIGDGVATVETLMRMIDQPPAGAEKATDAAAPKEFKKRANKFAYGPLTKARIFLAGAAAGSVAILMPPDKYNSLRLKNLNDVSDQRKFAFSDKISLDRIKAVKNKLQNATVNDVLIIMLTLTMKAYYEEVDDPAVMKLKRRVRAQFPISVRGRNDPAFRNGDSSNQFSYGFLTFYMNFKGSLLDLFWKIKRDLDNIKLSPAPYMLTSNGKQLAPFLPYKSLNSLSLKIGKAATGQLSNVAGPAQLVTMAGATVTDMSFQLFCPLALYLGILSYAGQVTCSICLEEKLKVDPNLIAKHWLPSFERIEAEMLKIDGVAKQPRYATDCL